MKAQITRLLPFLLATALVFAFPAFGNTFLFQVSSTAPSNGNPVNGQVIFNLFSSSLDIVLENTAGPGQLGAISSVLSGVSFDLIGGSPANLTLDSIATAAGFLDCTAGTATCDPGTAPPGDAFGWILTDSGPYLLGAGGGDFKPGGIVNSNLTGNTDGIRNAPHNNYLLGPVTFTVTFSGEPPTEVRPFGFYFGTVPDVLQPTPEPATLFPLAVLLAAAWKKYGDRRKVPLRP